tara:strand:- start:37864 stop:38040 length:177 start_codon:yes stop_codon:yes gene_type:complete
MCHGLLLTIKSFHSINQSIMKHDKYELLLHIRVLFKDSKELTFRTLQNDLKDPINVFY